MNRHDFRSAYDKIVLPESAKAEMKKKLLALSADRKAERDTEYGGEFYPAKEYRPQPKKRHTGRNAAIVGSAAAVALTVGQASGSAAVISPRRTFLRYRLPPRRAQRAQTRRSLRTNTT